MRSLRYQFTSGQMTRHTTRAGSAEETSAVVSWSSATACSNHCANYPAPRVLDLDGTQPIKPLLLVLRPSAAARLGLRLHSATRPKICFFAIHYTSFKSHDTHRGHEGVDATRQVATMSAPRLRLPNIIFVIASNVDVRQAQLFCGELLILQAPNKEIVPSFCISPCPNLG